MPQPSSDSTPAPLSRPARFVRAASVVTVIVGARLERPAVRALAAFVILVAAATLAEHASGRNLGLDQCIVPDDAPAPSTAAPGRMGINTAVAFILTATGLAVSGSGDRRSRRLSQWLGVTGGGLVRNT